MTQPTVLIAGVILVVIGAMLIGVSPPPAGPSCSASPNGQIQTCETPGLPGQLVAGLLLVFFGFIVVVAGAIPSRHPSGLLQTQSTGTTSLQGQGSGQRPCPFCGTPNEREWAFCQRCAKGLPPPLSASATA